VCSAVTLLVDAQREFAVCPKARRSLRSLTEIGGFGEFEKYGDP